MAKRNDDTTAYIMHATCSLHIDVNLDSQAARSRSHAVWEQTVGIDSFDITRNIRGDAHNIHLRKPHNELHGLQ